MPAASRESSSSRFSVSSRSMPATTAALATTRTTAATATARAGMRNRTVAVRWPMVRPWRSPAVRGKSVSRASDGLQRVPPERFVDQAPEPAHVDLDDVRVALEVEAPDAIEDLRLAQHATGSPDEELEQVEL